MLFEDPAQLVDVVVRCCGRPSFAITAFNHFSTACWAWKPSISSLISGLPANPRAAVASFLALRELRAARSNGSRRDEDTALSQRVVQHRALEVAPFIDVGSGNDDQVDRNAEVAKGFAEPDELRRRLLSSGSITSRSRSLSGWRQPLGSLADHVRMAETQPRPVRPEELDNGTTNLTGWSCL